FSDGDDLPRDHKKATKTKKAAPKSPKAKAFKATTFTKSTIKAHLQEQAEILAVLSDGGDLPRDRKTKTSTKKSSAKKSSAKTVSAKKTSKKTGKKRGLIEWEKRELFGARPLWTPQDLASPASVQRKVELLVKGGAVVVLGGPADAATVNDLDGFERVKSRRTLQAEKKEATAPVPAPVCHVASHRLSGSTCSRVHVPHVALPTPDLEVAPVRTAKTVWTRPTKVESSPSPPRSAEKNAQILKSLSKALIEAASPKQATKSPRPASAKPKTVPTKAPTKAAPTKAVPIATTTPIKTPPATAAHINVGKKARATLST
ncbi:hypothetical protein ACHHYP_09577, partial [Achlya hypogyna]